MNQVAPIILPINSNDEFEIDEIDDEFIDEGFSDEFIDDETCSEYETDSDLEYDEFNHLRKI